MQANFVGICNHNSSKGLCNFVGIVGVQLPTKIDSVERSSSIVCVCVCVFVLVLLVVFSVFIAERKKFLCVGKSYQHTNENTQM